MNSFISSMQLDFSESFSAITVFQLSVSPSDAVSRCVSLWKTKGARCASTGMQKQFKQRGWSGTELIIGHSGRAFLTNVFFETRSYRRLLSHAPTLVPDRIKRAAITKVYVDIIARTIESESRPVTELWCLTDWATRMNLSGFEKSYAESSMHSLEESFNAQGIMTAPARHLNRWDIPSDVPLSLPELTTMRKAAKKSRG
ncbi:hypothetical protein O3654_06780 [Pauljensenia sp. 20925_1_91]